MKHTGGIPQSILAKLDTAFGGFSEEQRAHLVELGLLKKNEKRSGVLRFRDSLNLSKVEAKTLGIHPNEASLILRWEANKKISWDRYLNQAAKSYGSKVIEQFNAIDEESKAIDLEWSCLNNQFMDDFYEVEALQVNKEDVWLKYFPPVDGEKFPNSAGQWIATSKKWGVKIFDNSIHPISATSPSKNRAVVLLLQKIEGTNEKYPVPFDPMQVDL